MAQLVRVVLGLDSVFVSSADEHSLQPSDLAVLGIGKPELRLAAWERLGNSANFPALLHPRADIGDSTTLGRGVVATSGVVATTDIWVGEGTLINWNATVGHDARIGRCCVVNPQASISGGVVLGDGVLVGTGANILEGRRVGSGARIGAGAVVTRDVPEFSTVVGVPARIIGGTL